MTILPGFKLVLSRQGRRMVGGEEITARETEKTVKGTCRWLGKQKR
jgi:hypothetical protein